MNQHITVAVIGATGKAGKYLLQQLLQDGYAVKALIRTPEACTITHHLLEVIQGNIQTISNTEKVLEGCDIVISTLGQTQGEPLISGIAASNIIAAMRQQSITRYIFICGLNIDVPDDKKSAQNRAKSEWMRDNFADVVADKQRAYDIVVTSDTDWTMVRLPFIVPTDEKGKLVVDLQDCPGENINACDLADFLISQIISDQYLKKAPFVASL